MKNKRRLPNLRNLLVFALIGLVKGLRIIEAEG
jgi:hypothetical protein